MARKEKNIHYLYKITCLENGKYYFGMHSTDNLEDNYMGSGRRMRQSLRKYGVENHTKEILEFFHNRDELIDGEKKLITEEILNDPKCLNIMSGGTGGFISEEQQRYRSICGGKSKAKKMKENPNMMEKHIEIFTNMLKKRHSLGLIKYDTFTGKKHKSETIEKMKNIKQGFGVGETNSQYGTCWITKDGINKKIKKDEINFWINDGWVKGRIL